MSRDDSRHTQPLILLVEGDSNSAMITQGGLEQKGYRVTHVTSGEKAIEAAFDDRIHSDVILMDIDLGPGVDGAQAAEEILRNKEIPIIFLCSQTTPEVIERAEKITPYGYVAKGSGITVLDASIKMALKLFHANREAREKEALLQSIAENYPHSFISIIEADYTVGFTSGQEFKKQHLDPKQFIDLTLDQIFGEQTDLVKRYYEKTFHGEECSFELFIHDQYQRYRTVPLMSPEGSIKQILAVVENITERKQAEKTLRENEVHLRTLIETIPDLIWLKDPDGVYMACNPKFERFFGAKESEIVGKTDYDFVDEELADFFRKNDKAAMNTGRPSINEEEIIQADDGQRLLLETIKTPMYDSRGKLLGVLGIARDITERKRMEEEIRQSEGTYRNLLKNLNAGIVVHAPDTSILIANPAACELLGLSEAQILGKEAFDPQWKFLRDDGSDMPLDEYPVNQVLSTKTPLRNMVVGVKRPQTNDIVWVLVNGFAVLHSSGRIEQAIVTFIDITERKQAEEALRRSERNLRESQRIAHLGSWYLDVATNQVVWTEELYKMYGFDSALAPPPYTEHMKLFTPESWGRLSTSLSRTRETGIPYELELETVRKDGENGWMWVRGEAINDAEGKTIGLWGAAQDISDRKQTERALKESEERFRALHNASFGGIAIHDNGVILECNKGLSEITGYTHHELIGMDGLTLISDETRAHVIQNINAGYEKPYEVTGVRKNGETYPLRLEARNIPYKGKDVRVVEFRDITEAKQIERELHRHRAHLEELVSERTAALQAANSELKSFAYIASHDLKAPLRAIGRLAHWLAQDYADVIDERGKEMAELLIGRVKRMDNLIEGILEYSRIGRVLGQCAPLDLNSLVTEVIDTLTPPAHVTVIIENELPVIVGDRIRIMQLFQNLIGNAIKFLGMSRGDVRIGCAPKESQWKFWVADTGPGIEERHCEQIFYIFQTLTPRDTQESTGIGLAIAKKIVEFYHGEIWVESTVGEGSTFFFLLPKDEKAV